MANTPTDFFSPLPMELLVYIYSNLSPKALLNAWGARNKIHQRAIEHVLFAKNEIEFYSSQIKVLTALSNSRTIINNDAEYLKQLTIKFSTKVKNPKLSLSDQLRGMKLLGTIWQVSLDTTLITSKL